MTIEGIFLIVILIMSVVVHEVSHGWMANWLGDPTARLQGRLTLNPISHLDLFGSILLPAMLVFAQSPFMFGWANPVPYNPYNLRRGGRWAEAMVAGAGPGMNILIAIVFAMVVRLFGPFAPAVSEIGSMVVLVNVMLAIFNLIPIPPLDGSKIFSAILPTQLEMQYARFRNALEFNPFLGFGVVILFVILFGNNFAQFVFFIVNILIS